MRERLRHCKLCGIGIATMINARPVTRVYCAGCSDQVRIDNQRRYQRRQSRIDKRDAAVAMLQLQSSGEQRKA